MPTNQTHSSSTQYQSSSTGAPTTIRVARTRKVTYVFDAKVASLRIPHAVAVNGVVQIEFAQKAHRLDEKSGEITVAAAPGDQVSLFLNSDAQPAWRKQPVYAVTVGNRDVVVTITEKLKKHTDTDSPILTRDADPTVEAAKTADTYRAHLTGDIWMKVSHKYTPAEVQPACGHQRGGRGGGDGHLSGLEQRQADDQRTRHRRHAVSNVGGQLLRLR